MSDSFKWKLGIFRVPQILVIAYDSSHNGDLAPGLSVGELALGNKACVDANAIAQLALDARQFFRR